MHKLLKRFFCIFHAFDSDCLNKIYFFTQFFNETTFLTRIFPSESPRKIESECGAKFIDFEPEFNVVEEIGSKIDNVKRPIFLQLNSRSKMRNIRMFFSRYPPAKNGKRNAKSTDLGEHFQLFLRFYSRFFRSRPLIYSGDFNDTNRNRAQS